MTKVANNTQIFIQTITSNHVLEAEFGGPKVFLAKKKKNTEDYSSQLWIKGEPSDEGYFTLKHIDDQIDDPGPDGNIGYDFLTAVSKKLTPCKDKGSQKKCKKCNVKECEENLNCKKECKKTCDLCDDPTRLTTKSNSLYFNIKSLTMWFILS